MLCKVIPQLKLFAWTPASLLTIVDCTFFFKRISVLTSSRNGVLVVDITPVGVL